MNLAVIVLTLNEARHLSRCLESVQCVGASVLVVDSFSTDDTLRIAEAHGAKVLSHPFINHASQFNWALSQLDETVEWVLRLDADEYLTPLLVDEIDTRLPFFGPHVDGVYCGRRMTFQGKLIRFGGVFPDSGSATVSKKPGPMRKPLDGRAYQGDRGNRGIQRGNN